MKQCRLGGLDRFRPVAALLVVAIHTGPLLSWSRDVNYLLCDILARLAVPFFFAVSGYFLVPELRARGVSALLPFLKKGLLLYGLSALLYAPINLYSGYFSQPGLPLELLRDACFNGLFYHLWYFPAVLLGGCIVCLLVRRLRLATAAAVCAVLYVLGLLGDSYYAFTNAIPPLKAFYEALFQCFDYTRNGLFFAPLFLLLGGWLAGRGNRRADGRYAAGLLLSLGLLLAEGLLVKQFHLARFDALYLSLPLCIFFLLCWLRGLDLPARPQLRRWSAAVYLLHPLCILLVRGGAKALGLSALLIENRLLHYLAVVFLSGLLAAPFALVPRKRPEPERGRAWIELDAAALRHNVNVLSGLLPEGCALTAVLKANAYGHGDLECARICQKAGIRSFAVATAAEGARLRRGGVRGDILVLGWSGAGAVPLLRRYRLTQTVASPEHARLLDRCGKRLRVHIKIDTGMHRLGTGWDDAASLRELYTCSHLQVKGLFTHLAASETCSPSDQACTQAQIRRFWHAVETLSGAGLPIGALHIQSSYGLLNYGPLEGCGWVRTGIALYGLLSAPQDHPRICPDLRPVLALRARVAQIHTLEPGEHAGYDGAFTASRPTRLALITIGYADGWPRALSCGRGRVLLHGQPAPIAGLICMDQLLADVTEIPDVRPGDTATLIGRDGDAVLTAEAAAEAAGTITNELLSRLGPRLPRIVGSEA